MTSKIPNKIAIPDWLTRTRTFLDCHANEYSRTTQAQVKEMFTLYNDQCWPPETGMFCSKCCGRVYNKLKAHYNQVLLDNQQIVNNLTDGQIFIKLKEVTENNGDSKETSKSEENKGTKSLDEKDGQTSPDKKVKTTRIRIRNKDGKKEK